MMDIAINFVGILNISIYKAKGDALIGDNYSGLKVVDHVKKKLKMLNLYLTATTSYTTYGCY